MASLPAEPSATVPLSVHFALIEGGVRLLDDPGFVIDIAQHVPVETYDVMGFAMRSAADLARAVEVAQRFQQLYTTASTFEIERNAQGLRVWFRPSGPLPLAARLATESAVAQWLSIARALAGVELNPAAVSFRHEAPRTTRRHREFFGVPVAWNAPLAAMTFRAEDAGRAVQQADPTLHAFLLRAAASALSAHRPPDSFLDHVRRAAAELLPSGNLDVDSLATRLGMGARTLRRRLSEHGSSFLKVRDDIRAQLAERYLEEQGLPILEIAFLLDFADERAFRRSFLRWTGKTPAEFRAGRAATRATSRVRR